MAKERILVVEDDEHIWQLLSLCLRDRGLLADHAANGNEALKMIEKSEWDVIFLDYVLPDTDGLSVLERIQELDAELPVIFMTAHGSVENAVAAMKGGAFDYLTKPIPLEAVIPKVNKALEITVLRRELRLFRSRFVAKYGFDNVVGQSRSMTDLLDTCKTIAQSEAETILLLGESGVGKNLIAQAIHYNSRRANRPFMTITCTSLAENLLESELFGHEKGAFTDARQTKKGLCELADMGTVFLDEIGDMPLGLQAKLLGFLENRSFRRVGGVIDYKVDIRVVAATNMNLRQAMLEKRFREDLFYRLNVMEINIPPLRERSRDIPLLANHFINQFNEKFRKQVSGLNQEAMTALTDYQWPGNVRELRNMLERAMILTKNKQLTLADLSPDLLRASPLSNNAENGGFALTSSGICLEDHERDLVRQALHLARNNQSKAAKLLGISRNQLIYRLKKFNFA